MSNCVSVTEVTTIAGWVAGLGMIALIASGWRQPARVEARSPRVLRTALFGLWHRVSRRSRVPDVADQPVPDAHDGIDPHSLLPTPWWKRIRSVVGGTGLAIWSGAMIATAVGFAVAFVVITLTGMLRR